MRKRPINEDLNMQKVPENIDFNRTRQNLQVCPRAPGVDFVSDFLFVVC